MPSDPWIIRTRPRPQPRLRLFCFPYAGGGASIYTAWPNELPLEIELCAVQLPGRESRLAEPAYTHIVPLVQALGPVLTPHLDPPYAFFGHSMGALIAFELAHLLRDQGRRGPAMLFVSGHTAPQIPDTDPPIHGLPRDQFINELRRFEGTPEAVLQSDELMDLLLDLLRADITLNETYTCAPRDPLDCPISAFGGLEDRDVSRADLDAWRIQTRSAFKLRMLPGGHFFLRQARSLILRALVKDLRLLWMA